MAEEKFAAREFEANRARLHAVAYRMLGSASEAEDAVQEAWLRLSRTGADDIDNLGGWLTTVTARVCLDMLRSRKARREDELDVEALERNPALAEPAAAERDILMGDAVGAALLLVLQTLSPSERIAFVLHDMFDVAFDEIAPIVGRSPEAARQLASRARRRVRGQEREPEPDREGQRRIVRAFLAASREGNFEGLLHLLDPDVSFRADAAAIKLGAAAQIFGAQAVAENFHSRARGLHAGTVDGRPAFIAAPGGKLRLVLVPTVGDGQITAVEAIADPERLGRMEIVLEE